MGKILSIIIALMLSSGCAAKYHTSGNNIKALARGQSYESVKEVLNVNGRPFYLIRTNGSLFKSIKYYCEDNKKEYFLLWQDNYLQNAYLRSEQSAFEKALCSNPPSEDNIKIISQFVSDTSEFNTSNIVSGNKVDRGGEYLEWIVWAPAIVILSPIIIPSAIYADSVYRDLDRISLDMTKTEIVKILKEPKFKISERSENEIWQYDKGTLFFTPSERYKITLYFDGESLECLTFCK